MNTEHHAWYSSQVRSAADWRTPTVCGCGQDLDLSTSGHCPRCGVSLTSRAA